MRIRSKGNSLGWIRLVAVLILLLVPAVLQGCGRSGGASNGKVTLILGAYTTPREAYGKAIIPAFQKHWKEKTGQEVEFQESYQASGAQSRAIVGGFEADIAALSLEGDVDKIAEAGLITHDWKAKPYNGMVSTSIVVIATRQGNPKGIKDWPDLAQPGLNVLTPDPKTSGGAQWNINAMYGAALRGFAGVPKDDPHAAQQFLRGVFRNVSIMDKGARESITNYEKGVGDVAITYENEVLVGRQAGQTYEYVIPRSTILIENPVALIDKNVDKHGVREVAAAFIDFLWSKEAQRAYARYGLRPLDPEVAKEVQAQYPPVADLWKIDYLGGWKRVTQDIYGPQGVYTKVIQELQESR
ncbi:MAG TPA: sulfate ABC transporter substrate-binding protein [Blastocatellia bacterium]|nr:sulfate ABC transporter substrate-binding protein [Blastocatellia bacterium]